MLSRWLSFTCLLLLSLPTLAATPPFAALFAGYDGCFILQALDRDTPTLRYDTGQRCQRRLSSYSTFKIPLALMAWDQGLLQPQTVFTWNGVRHAGMPQWDRDQTPISWLQQSVVWVSQQVTPQLGAARIQRYLARFEYGNQDFSGDPGQHNGLTHAWLGSSLQISAEEQVGFLRRLLRGELGLRSTAFPALRQGVAQGLVPVAGQLFGKTGAGRQRLGATGQSQRLDGRRDGWFVGWLERPDGTRYVFAANVSDRRAPPAGSATLGVTVAKPLVQQALERYFTR